MGEITRKEFMVKTGCAALAAGGALAANGWGRGALSDSNAYAYASADSQKYVREAMHRKEV